MLAALRLDQQKGINKKKGSFLDQYVWWEKQKVEKWRKKTTAGLLTSRIIVVVKICIYCPTKDECY